MKRLICKLLLFFPILIAMVAVNVLVDPSNIFEEGYEAEAAALVLKGKNVVGMTNYNERLFQEQIVLNEARCPKTIIIGSSRVMELSDESIPAMGTYRNLGLSGAGIYDYYGILGLYCYKNKMPDRVILGLDPWILNANNGDKRYESLQAYINVFEQAIQGTGTATKTMKAEHTQSLTARMQMLSPSYFQSSVQWAVKHPKELFSGGSFDFYGTTERIVDQSIRYADGSIEYDLKRRTISVDAANNSAKSYVAGKVYQMEQFNGLSQEYSDKLIQLVDYLQSRNVEVVFFLPPFHPFVYRYLSTHSEYSAVVDAEVFFRELANQRGIAVYGSFDPTRLSCDEECFLDGMHLRRSRMSEAWKIVSD